MRLEALSGDSTVSDVRYVDGITSILFKDYESDEEYLLKLETDRFYSQATSEEGAVHIWLERLETALEIDSESGRYLLPADLGKQFSSARQGFHLAVGLKAAEFPFLFQVRGYNVLFAAPIRGPDAVRVSRRPKLDAV